eukprot:PhM_4_TR6268/c0_g2_i1/m.83063
MGIAATNIYYFLERNLLTMLEGGYPLLEETNPLPRLTVGAPKEKLKEVWKLLNKYKPTWDGGLGQIKDHSLVIETGDARPISHRPFHVNPLLEKILRDEIEDLLSKGVIRPSKSAWASPCFLTEKKEGDVKVKKRLVVDYRPLNAVTKRDCDGPPLVAEVLEKVASSRVYSKFDLNQGFYQLPVHPDSVEKTAFVSPMGCYEFLVMPFGVTNGPAEFQKYMRARFQCEWCEVFIDDLIIHSEAETHLERLAGFFEKLKRFNLTVKGKKCEIWQDQIELLGHTVRHLSIKPGRLNANSLLKTRIPQTRKQLQGFLGLAGYFRKFVRNYAEKTKPLTELLRKDAKWEWGTHQAQAFSIVVEEITALPSLTVPLWDKPFQLETDASAVAIGAVLVQEGRPICFASRTLNDAERNYDAMARECLAVVYFRKHFSYYLAATQWEIITDSDTVKYIFGLQHPKGRLARWVLEYQDLAGRIRYRKGTLNVTADYLSRLPPEPSTELNALEFALDVEERKLLELQRRDPTFRDAFDRLEDELNPYWDEWYMKLNSGVVATTKGQRIVPEELRKELFHKWHGSDTIGHMGANRLYGLMNRHFYWPKMKVDIKKWTRECAACDKLRGPPRKVRLNPQLGVDVLKQWQVDLATMPKSKSGNNQLLALVDVGSRFPFAFALKDTDATTLINVITREVMPFIGVPEVVHTDNGQQFASKMWEAVFGSMGVKTRYSPVYSPQGK